MIYLLVILSIALGIYTIVNSIKALNKIKRMSLLIINTAIALAIYYVIMVLIYTIFQKPLMEAI